MSSNQRIRRLILLHVQWITVVLFNVMIHCIAAVVDGLRLFECVGSHRLVVAPVLTDVGW